ncbi:PAS domain S-box protein [Scytonema sp. UIC 10036]|uniref:PAS domain-containing hybrid sensor histidine kinase/response regulator n=1 Tax=Scytonema sp. UIC 10036 TaxID=2304196 RepID=UPI0012DACCB4|nr:PAS domain S-box protein [Scytonema sp. UIC 10036]MUG98563.1 PAS domain S-box protein [Scytonema sp. UIC 10036]
MTALHLQQLLDKWKIQLKQVNRQMYPDTNKIEKHTAALSQANALLQKEIKNRKQAEEQIQFQASILSRVNDAVIAIDSHNRITYWNKAAERLYEYKAEEVLGRSLEEVNHYRWLEAEDEQTAYTALATRGIWQGENIHRKKNGEEIYVESSVSILTDDNGVSNGFLAVVRDITERKQAEQQCQLLLTQEQVAHAEAKVAKNQIFNILERIADGFLALDCEWRFTYVNQQAAQILHRTQEQLIGKNVWEEFPDAIALSFYREYHRAVAQQVTVEFEEFYPSLNTWFEVHAYPTPEGLSVYFQDITKRKQTEQKISQQADLLNIATDAILVCNLKNQILFWNKGAEHLYGWQATEVLGKNANQLLYKEISPQLEEAVLAVIEHGSWQGELNQILKDSKNIIVQSRWTLVRDRTGHPQSILIVNTDITEKKQLEAQFFRAQRLESLGTLASGIAHDFNNILTPILIVTQLLSHKCLALNEEDRQLLKTVEDSSKRGATLVKQILSFAQGSEGDRVHLQVRHLLKEIEQILKSTFPKSIEININRLMENLWTIWANATQLHQVLLNLCVNARDAMPNGGTLSLSAENVIVNENDARMNLDAKVGSFVAISISDTGCGISPEIQERIFDPFFTTKEKSKGTGLGLSTVLGIVKNHGGFVKVYSQLGKGSQFKVYLPASDTQIKQEAADIKMPRGNGELILIVDDEEHIREATKTALENYNYKILTASDALEAFSIFTQRRDDIKLVLMDIQMPLMDGRNAACILQKINPSVKIIAISGILRNQKLLEASDIGVKVFLSKPYMIQELLHTIKRVLNAS